MPKRNGPGIELLADPTRRRIIAMLAVRACRPSTLSRDLHLSRPATSRQLGLLVDAGLIERHRSFVDGRSILYRIPPQSQRVILAWLAGTDVGRPILLSLDDNGTLREG